LLSLQAIGEELEWMKTDESADAAQCRRTATMLRLRERRM
jgi:hypothetical protein